MYDNCLQKQKKTNLFQIKIDLIVFQNHICKNIFVILIVIIKSQSNATKIKKRISKNNYSLLK